MLPFNPDLKIPNFVFVHGFLGLPEDWQQIQQQILEQGPATFKSIHLWDEFKAIKNNPINESLKVSLQILAKRIASHCVVGSVVVGYSLGGRILLHLPEECLKSLRGIVLISSHLGLETSEEKKNRLNIDTKWAQAFRNENWDLLMAHWNSQVVFSGEDDRPQRFEKNYNRAALAEVIEHCSLAHQEFLGGQKNFPWEKTLFISGKKDLKYANSIERWKKKYTMLQSVATQSGHYPLSVESRSVAQEICKFFSKI